MAAAAPKFGYEIAKESEVRAETPSMKLSRRSSSVKSRTSGLKTEPPLNGEEFFFFYN